MSEPDEPSQAEPDAVEQTDKVASNAASSVDDLPDRSLVDQGDIPVEEMLRLEELADDDDAQTRDLPERMSAIIGNLQGALSPAVTGFLAGFKVPEASVLKVPFYEDTTFPDVSDMVFDQTPQLQLEVMESLAEQMSQVVRLTAEQRDLIAEQRDIALQERDAARVDAKKSLRHSWGALVGTWLAVVFAVVTILVGR